MQFQKRGIRYITEKKQNMVYLLNQPGPQAVLIPKPCNLAGSLTMVLRSTVNLSKTFDAPVLDLAVSVLYYYVAVTVPDGMQPGEYEYVLKAGDEVAATGIAIMRDAVQTVQYEKPIEYEQYETS